MVVKSAFLKDLESWRFQNLVYAIATMLKKSYFKHNLYKNYFVRKNPLENSDEAVFSVHTWFLSFSIVNIFTDIVIEFP